MNAYRWVMSNMDQVLTNWSRDKTKIAVDICGQWQETETQQQNTIYD